MGRNDEYVHGSTNCICQRCGMKYKRSHIKLEWTGLRVCHGPNTSDCWEERHPQDFVKGVADKQSMPWVRPEETDNFLTTNEIGEDDL